MKKASLIVHQNYVEVVIKTLHETGLMEIIDISREEPDEIQNLEQASMDPDASVCTTYELRLAKLIDILKRTKKRSSGLKTILHPQIPEVKTVEERSLEELFSYAEGVLVNIEKNILENEQKLVELDEQKQKINQDFQTVEHLTSFDLDLSYIGESKYLIVKAGKTSDLPTIKDEIGERENIVLYSKNIGTKKKPEWAILLAAHISEKEEIEKICREKILEFNLKHLKDSPEEVLKSLKKEMINVEKEKIKITSKLNEQSEKQLPDLLALREEIQLERVEKDVTKNFAKTQTTYVIKGWVLEKKDDELKNLITSVSKDHVLYNSQTPSANPDNPPTYIKKPKRAAAFRTIVELFATPKYDEVDPTIFVGIFFILFFGFMLGDAGYGLVILFASLFGFFRLGRHSFFIKNWSFLGIWLGLTTTVVGFLTNSFFGNLVPRFIYNNPDKPLYSITVIGVDLPIDGLRNPIILLTIALILALIQLNLGVILGLCQSYKRRDYKSMVMQNGSWIPMQLGGGMLIGYFILDWHLGTTMIYIASILTLLGVILLFIYTRGPIGFFSITGYVGDWLSYARLIALGLSTSGMALACNVVGGLILQMVPIIGVVLFVIVMIFAHAANLLIQSLGAAVHSLRLQYIEFFNRFYEGGGKKFTPFKIRRVYTKIETKNVE